MSIARRVPWATLRKRSSAVSRLSTISAATSSGWWQQIGVVYRVILYPEHVEIDLSREQGSGQDSTRHIGTDTLRSRGTWWFGQIFEHVRYKPGGKKHRVKWCAPFANVAARTPGCPDAGKKRSRILSLRRMQHCQDDHWMAPDALHGQHLKPGGIIYHRVQSK